MEKVIRLAGFVLKVAVTKSKAGVSLTVNVGKAG